MLSKQFIISEQALHHLLVQWDSEIVAYEDLGNGAEQGNLTDQGIGASFLQGKVKA